MREFGIRTMPSLELSRAAIELWVMQENWKDIPSGEPSGGVVPSTSASTTF